MSELTKIKQKNLPKSNAEYQATYRAKKAAEKLHEVRGIYASEENTAKIKKFAETLK